MPSNLGFVSSTFCRAPDVWRVISANGDIQPCCSYRGNIGHVRAGGIDRVRFDRLKADLNSGVKASGCRECWYREGLGLNPHRLYQDEWLNMDSGVRILEFNLSNTCNLKCRMCNGDSSSSWIQEEAQLRKDKIISSFRQQHGIHLAKAFPKNEDLIHFLDQQDLSKLSHVTFKGGEPLLQNQLPLVIDYLKEKKLFDIHIFITSSGTIINKSLSALTDFREVEFSVSVEGTGALYSYIRGGDKYHLSDVENTISYLKTLPNFKIISQSCISAYNILRVPELYSWIVKNIPHNALDFESEKFVPVSDPSYLNPNVLPLDIREENLELSLALLKRDGLYSNNIERVLEAIMDLKAPYDIENSIRFVQFTKNIDNLRNQSISSVLPELQEFFDSPIRI